MKMLVYWGVRLLKWLALGSFGVFMVQNLMTATFGVVVTTRASENQWMAWVAVIPIVITTILIRPLLSFHFVDRRWRKPVRWAVIALLAALGAVIDPRIWMSLVAVFLAARAFRNWDTRIGDPNWVTLKVSGGLLAVCLYYTLLNLFLIWAPENWLLPVLILVAYIVFTGVIWRYPPPTPTRTTTPGGHGHHTP